MSLATFVRRFQRDKVTDVAAMLTYYAVFALFPLALFIVTVALLILPTSAIEEAVAMATRTVPPQVAQLITQQALHMEAAAAGGLVLGSAALALFAASRGALSLGRALNAIFNEAETRPWWKLQLRAVAVTLGVSAIVLIALALLVLGPVAGGWLAEQLGLGGPFRVAWRVGRWVGAALLIMFVWSVLYRFLPDTHARFRLFSPGAVVGVLLWIGATYLFSLYVRSVGHYERTYGALGAVIVFLTWLWLSNLALLIGAEIDGALGVRGGRRAGARPGPVGAREPKPA